MSLSETSSRCSGRPGISVVIPVRNAENTLSDCLESLARQTFRDFEALLIDDGSDDSSWEIARAWSRKDGRFRVLTPGRVGLVAALNLGIARARAGLIARMDSDDVMHEDRLRLQSRFLHANSGISLVGSRVELFPEEAVREGYREYVRWQNGCLHPEDIAANLFVESPFAHPSVMFLKSAFDAVGGYHDGLFPEDYDLWLRLHETGHRMAKLPDVLLFWRERPDRTSRTDPRYSEKAFDLLRALYLARDPRVRSNRTRVAWSGGRSTRLRVGLLMGQGVDIHAWVDVDPRRIGMTIRGLPVHPPAWLDRSDRPFVLIYVANHGAREKIAEALDQWGYRRGADYLAVG